MLDRPLTKLIAGSIAALATVAANSMEVTSDQAMPFGSGVISQDIAFGLENSGSNGIAGLFECSVGSREADCNLTRNVTFDAVNFIPAASTSDPSGVTGSLADELSNLISSDQDATDALPAPLDVTAQPAIPTSQVTLVTPLPASGLLFAAAVAGIAASKRFRRSK